MKNKFLCIHGHFYQPPRENPWLEEVEAEDSAFPFHDWNERILHECYGPNSASPILGKDGKIDKLLDDYRLISFNFGPTLLSWLERRAPRTYRAILEADRASVQDRGGHGNAVAQAYNHMILPLATLRDKKTQVRWGREDFRLRFGREPEGMWLPETAVDDETLEVLASEGVLFTVLAPAQAAKVRPVGGGEEDWLSTNVDSLDPTRPYRWFSKEQPGKHVDLFFYHRRLAQGVAFERMLDDGARFAARLMEPFAANDAAQLIHIATDGESYGHHHKFGNMALSFALDRFPRDTGVRLTNYGEFLSLFPPPQEAAIRPNTAWSCAHGLGRWTDDCGCKTGAAPKWHQRWRRPLRDALEWLAVEIDSVYTAHARELLRDPWAARDAYGRRLIDLGAVSTHDFLRRHEAKHLSPEEARAAVRLCEMQRHRLLMFTSCGWFFDEVSGIEGVQILKYACRAIELAESFGASLREAFVERLRQVPSNAPEYGDAGAVFQRLVEPLRVDLRRAAAHFGILDHLEEGPTATPHYSYEVKRHPVRRVCRREGARERTLTVAHIELRRFPTLEHGSFTVAVHHRGGVDVECWLLPGSTPERSRDIEGVLAVEFAKDREDDFLRAVGSFFPKDALTLDALFGDRRRKAIAALLPRGTPETREALKAWCAEVRYLRKDSERLPDAVRAMHAAARAGIAADALPDASELRERLLSDFTSLLVRHSDDVLRRVLWLHGELKAAGLRLDRWELQDLYATWRARTRMGSLAANPVVAEALATLGAALDFSDDAKEPAGKGTP